MFSHVIPAVLLFLNFTYFILLRELSTRKFQNVTFETSWGRKLAPCINLERKEEKSRRRRGIQLTFSMFNFTCNSVQGLLCCLNINGNYQSLKSVLRFRSRDYVILENLTERFKGALSHFAVARRRDCILLQRPYLLSMQY